MKPRLKVILTTVVAAAAMIVLSPQTPVGHALWPEPNHDAQPSSVQIPFFMLMGVLEALASGLGIAYWAFGWNVSRRAAPTGTLGLHVAVGWLLGNWWIHSTLHFLNGLDLGGLLAIDWGFHGTLIVSGAYIMWKLCSPSREDGTDADGLILPIASSPLGSDG